MPRVGQTWDAAIIMRPERVGPVRCRRVRRLAASGFESIARRFVGEAGSRTRLANRLATAGIRVGITPYNWRLLRSTRRLRWHYRDAARMARPRWSARTPAPVGEEDEALCKRLIVAYHHALEGRPGATQASGMWSWIYESHQAALAELMDGHDARALAGELASMFSKPFVHGIAPSALASHRESSLGARIWRVRTLDSLVSLAQALGVVPVDDPAIGRQTARAFDGGLAALVDRVEERLGFSIDFPDVGAPQGLLLRDRLLTMDSPEQIYTAYRLGQAMRLHLSVAAAEAPNIVEIGGGYGASCLWLLRYHGTVRRYTIVDLPLVNVLQGYFLCRALGHSAVSLFGEEPASVVVAPNSGLGQLERRYDTLVNKDSMPEMPEKAALEYLRWGRSACEGIFFSCNQESQARFQGEEQGLVGRAVEQVGGYSLLRRDQSWVRPGYVEEVYAVGAGG